MRKTILFLFLLGFSLYPSERVRAQSGEPRLSSLQIDLWPEYDQSAVLVIYNIVLDASVPLPAEVAFHIPTEAGEPNAVAQGPAGSGLLNAEYSRTIQGGWAEIRFQAVAPNLRIEYYDPRISRDGTARTFVFNWPGDYAAASLIMLVQQPIGASNLITVPNLSSINQDTYGLYYHGADVGALNQGETFQLTVSYSKTTDDLTVNFLPLESSAPLSAETAGRVSFLQILPWAMGVLGLLLIGLGVYWYFGTTRKERRPASEPAVLKRKVLSPAGSLRSDPQEGVFCHQCGKRASSGDRFCRACGTKLRL